jgi:hypothetical protein
MFMVDKDYQIRQRTSQYYAARLLTQEWAQPVNADHRLFRAASDLQDTEGHTLVTAYPLQRPDGQWSVLLINKDHDHPRKVRIEFNDAEKKQQYWFSGDVMMITFGEEQYRWHPGRKAGYADPDNPPATSSISASPGTEYRLPPASVTVLRGRLSSK